MTAPRVCVSVLEEASGLQLTMISPREWLHREGGRGTLATIHSSDHLVVCGWLTFQAWQWASHDRLHVSECGLVECLNLRPHDSKAFNCFLLSCVYDTTQGWHEIEITSDCLTSRLYLKLPTHCQRWSSTTNSDSKTQPWLCTRTLWRLWIILTNTPSLKDLGVNESVGDSLTSALAAPATVALSSSMTASGTKQI